RSPPHRDRRRNPPAPGGLLRICGALLRQRHGCALRSGRGDAGGPAGYRVAVRPAAGAQEPFRRQASLGGRTGGLKPAERRGAGISSPPLSYNPAAAAAVWLGLSYSFAEAVAMSSALEPTRESVHTAWKKF